jgi:hypothetical protein
MAMLTLGALATACSSASKTSTDAATHSDGARDVASDRSTAVRSDSGRDARSDTFLGCSPGDLLEPRYTQGFCVYGRCICQDYSPDGGTLVPISGPSASTGIISYQLPQPMKAGQPYTFSFNYSNENFTGDLELWGADAECGAGLQKLFTGQLASPLVSKVFCATAHPTADYAYVLFVENHTGKGDASSAASNMTGLTACPTATCP